MRSKPPRTHVRRPRRSNWGRRCSLFTKLLKDRRRFGCFARSVFLQIRRHENPAPAISKARGFAKPTGDSPHPLACFLLTPQPNGLFLTGNIGFETQKRLLPKNSPKLPFKRHLID